MRPHIQPRAIYLSAPTLQKYILLHLLPKRLVVHDPGDVLAVSRSETDDYGDSFDWTQKSDITRVYRLGVS